MGKEKKKVLFVSHGAKRQGAPISLAILMRYFKRHYDWDIRILVRLKGPLQEEYERIAPTRVFYEHWVPPIWSQILPRAKYWLLTAYNWREALSIIRKPYRNPEARARQARHVIQLRDEYARWEPDLIYVNTAMNGDVLNKLALKAPVVVHVRELAGTFRQINREKINHFRHRPVFYFPVSVAVKDYLRQAYKIAEDRMQVAPVALECDVIERRSEKISHWRVRKELELDPRDLNVGAVGFLGKRKGPDVFVTVAHKIIERLDGECGVNFIWLGEGNERESVEKMTTDLGLADRVKFVGQRENPYPYMRCFDLLLMTSSDDPFPRVNLEVGLLGKPVVCFGPSGGSKEYVQDDAGFVVPGFDVDLMAERALTLIRNRRLRETLGANGRRKVLERYSVDSVAPAIADRLEPILANGQS